MDISKIWNSIRSVLILYFLLAFSHGEAAVTTGFWNVFNHPNDTTDETNFSTVLGAVGPVDVWGLAETDTSSAASFTALAGPSYSSFTSSSSGGDRTAIIWNTSTLTSLSSGEFTSGLTHPTAWTVFRPVGTSGEADFLFVTTHLKSGSGSSNLSKRGAEANSILAELGLSSVDTQILAGDFNWSGASEAAFQNFASGGLNDVAGQVGEWRDNSAYLEFHTQDPGAAMDDRFDMILASGELFDGIGLDYVSDSFDVFGNDGSHTLNGQLTANSEADATVVNALLAASDHLPITATFEILPNSIPEPQVGLLFGSAAICFCIRRMRKH